MARGIGDGESMPTRENSISVRGQMRGLCLVPSESASGQRGYRVKCEGECQEARLKGCTGSSKQLVQVFKDRFPGPSLVPQRVWENLG